jgi:excisionase family DNA binding protein
MVHNLPRLLTPKEVAVLLGVSEHSLAVWRCTKRYRLPFVKSGKLVRYNERDVARFIEERTMNRAGGAE